MKASDLSKMIRAIVREEVETVLPKLVEKHLTEAYIKRLVSESAVRPQKRSTTSVMELMDREEEEDEVPAPKQNTNQGIYDPSSGLMQKKNESVNKDVLRKLVGQDNPMAWIYEGVKPAGPAAPPPISAQLPDADFGAINERVAAMERHAQDHKPMEASYEAKMKELERKRAALDVPVKR